MLAGFQPSDALHDVVQPVFSQDRRDVLDNPKDAVGSDPDSPLELRQLFQRSTVLQPIRPPGPKLLQLGSERGVTKSPCRNRGTVAFATDFGWTCFTVEVKGTMMTELEWEAPDP